MDATLALIRHGESAWNAERRLQGHLDIPLSARGREQCAALRRLLGPSVATALSSDLARTRETAELLGLTVRFDPRWREIGLGGWAGRLVSEADAESPQLASWRGGPHTPQGGEPWARFATRIGAAVDALAAAGGDWLVVTHGGCIRAACAHITGADAVALATPPNASLTRLRLGSCPALLSYGVLPEGATPTGVLS